MTTGENEFSDLIYYCSLVRKTTRVSSLEYYHRNIKIPLSNFHYKKLEKHQKLRNATFSLYQRT